MTLSIRPVLTANIHQTWPLVESFLAEALKWGEDDYTAEQAKVYLAKGDWLLVVAVDEATVVEPRFKVIETTLLATTTEPDLTVPETVIVGSFET